MFGNYPLITTWRHLRTAALCIPGWDCWTGAPQVRMFDLTFVFKDYTRRVDDQAEAPEVRRSGYSPARVFMLGPPGMTAQSVAPQAARVAPAGAASVVSSVAPAKPKPDRYAPPPVKVDPRFDANAQPMSSFTPAATENRDFQPQALKTQNVAGGQGPADAWTTVRNTKPKPSRTKKGQLEERVARVRATTDGAVEARTKEILKARRPLPPLSLLPCVHCPLLTAFAPSLA